MCLNKLLKHDEAWPGKLRLANLKMEITYVGHKVTTPKTIESFVAALICQMHEKIHLFISKQFPLFTMGY